MTVQFFEYLVQAISIIQSQSKVFCAVSPRWNPRLFSKAAYKIGIVIKSGGCAGVGYTHSLLQRRFGSFNFFVKNTSLITQISPSRLTKFVTYTDDFLRYQQRDVWGKDLLVKLFAQVITTIIKFFRNIRKSYCIC